MANSDAYLIGKAKYKDHDEKKSGQYEELFGKGLKERAIQLTRREFDLLYLLASRPGQVFSREQLYSHIWNADTEFGVDEAVRFQIKSLRKKLTRTRGSYIQTVRGIGYRFDSEKE